MMQLKISILFIFFYIVFSILFTFFSFFHLIRFLLLISHHFLVLVCSTPTTTTLSLSLSLSLSLHRLLQRCRTTYGVDSTQFEGVHHTRYVCISGGELKKYNERIGQDRKEKEREKRAGCRHRVRQRCLIAAYVCLCECLKR